VANVFVELCAGLASVTLSMFDLKPPVSRIGAKTGYTAVLRKHLGLTPWKQGAYFLLVDSDPAVCNVLHELLQPSHYPGWDVAGEIASLFEEPPRDVRDFCAGQRYRLGPRGAATWLLWTASSRGGIGGFKGAHKLRPNVDGFIPSRKSLAKRVKAITELSRGCLSHHFEIRCCSAHEVQPIPGATVYIDPPYENSQEYGDYFLSALKGTADAWRSAGCLVAVSERVPLPWGKGWRHVNITKERVGQCRRSMTRSTEEWLTIGGAK
jgi:hypothetical protein